MIASYRKLRSCVFVSLFLYARHVFSCVSFVLRTFTLLLCASLTPPFPLSIFISLPLSISSFLSLSCYLSCPLSPSPATSLTLPLTLVRTHAFHIPRQSFLCILLLMLWLRPALCSPLQLLSYHFSLIACSAFPFPSFSIPLDRVTSHVAGQLYTSTLK